METHQRISKISDPHNVQATFINGPMQVGFMQGMAILSFTQLRPKNDANMKIVELEAMIVARLVMPRPVFETLKRTMNEPTASAAPEGHA